MTLKLASLLFLPALTTAAFAQTAPQAPARKPPASASHSAAHSPIKATAVSRIPRVPGIPKTLYALKYIDTKIGTGPLGEQHKFYTVRYTGWLKDGTKFDSSYDHPGGEPITFPYGAHRVIPGWDSGFEGMHVGGKRRLFIPYQLAYGESGRPPVIPAKADLIFDLELVSQSDTPPAPKQPPPGSQQPKPSSAPPSGAPNPQPKPSEAAPDSTARPAPPSHPAAPAPQPPPQTTPAPPAPQPAPTPQPQTPPHPESR